MQEILSWKSYPESTLLMKQLAAVKFLQTNLVDLWRVVYGFRTEEKGAGVNWWPLQFAPLFNRLMADCT